MSESAPLPAHHEQPRWRWWLLLAAIAVTLVLGVRGFREYERAAAPAAGELGRLAALYDTLQLFALHTPHLDERLVNPSLDIARWVAAAISLWTVFATLRRVFAMEVRRFRLSLSRNHVVICGAGWRGLPLAREFSKPGRARGRRGGPVIVVEKDPGSPGLRECQELGIPCLVADASDPAVLRAAGVHKARLLVITCSSDPVNLEVAIHARRLARAFRRQREALRCHLHLSNPDLRSAVRQKSLLADVERRIAISTFGVDIYENSARRLFQRHPLDFRAIGAGSPLRAHLVIIGLGDMGESVLIQAARIGHFANGRGLRITVADRDPAARSAGLLSRYPQLPQVCDVEFRGIDAKDPALLALSEKICGQPEELVTFAVCLPDSAFNIALGFKLAEAGAVARSGSPIAVRVSSRSGLTLLLSEKRQRELFGDRIRPFGMLEEVCNRETLEGPEVEDLARSLHEDYVRRESLRGQGGSSLKSWADLPEDLRRSNYHAADHCAIKLRALGLTVAGPGKSQGRSRSSIPRRSRFWPAWSTGGSAPSDSSPDGGAIPGPRIRSTRPTPRSCRGTNCRRAKRKRTASRSGRSRKF